MLSRIRSLLTPAAAASANTASHSTGATTQQVRGRFSNNYRRSRVSPPPPPPPTTTVAVPAAAAGKGTGGAGGESTNKFDPSKWVRPAFFVLGAGFFLSRFLTDPNNPDSFVNRAMNPRGKGKYMLKVEKMDDTLAAYNSSFVGASQGARPAIQSQMRYQLSKRLGVEVS